MKIVLSVGLLCVSGCTAIIATQALLVQMGFGVLFSSSMLIENYSAGMGVQAAFFGLTAITTAFVGVVLAAQKEQPLM